MRTGAAALSAVLLSAAAAHGADRLVPVDVLFTEPQVYAYQLSPDAGYLAGYLNLEDNRHLVLVDTTDARTYGLIDFRNFPNARIQELEWVDNDTLFLRLASTQGDEDMAFVDFRFVNGLPEPIIRRIEAKGFLVDPLPEAEDTVLFAREIYDSSYRLYRISVDQLQRAAFSAAPEFMSRLKDAVYFGRDPNSRRLLAITRDGDRRGHWYLDESRRSWVRYFEHDSKEYRFFPVGWLGDTRLAVLTNKDVDRLALVEFDFERKEFGAVLYQHPRYDLTGAEVDGAFVRSVSYVDHGRPVTEYFAAAESHVARLLEKAFPGKNVHLLTRIDGRPKAVLYVSASDDPGAYYLLDTRTGNAQPLSARYPAVEEYPLTPSTVFNVATADGEEIEAILTRPEEPNGVLLVNPHGGPIGFRDDARYDPEVQFLASRGYSVLKVNFRGSSGFGRDFLETGRGQFGKRIEEDIAAAVGQVTSQHEFTHLCAIGMSYGGYSALMLPLRSPGRYRCAISRFGMSDLPLLFNASNYSLLEERQRSLTRVVGEYSDDLKQVSPFHLAEQVAVPVLLLAGMNDPIADVEQTNRLKFRLRQLGKPVEYFYYPDAAHGHSSWLDARHEFALIDDFIRRTLGLGPPKGENANEVLAGEYLLIGDYYRANARDEERADLAFRYYEKAAGLGSGPALTRLAALHEDEDLVRQDPGRAHSYLLKASDLGDAEATYRLARLYRDGSEGGLVQPVDLPRSVELFRRAVEQGHAFARFDLARALCTGEGVEPDVERCLTLLALDPEDGPDADVREQERRRTGALGPIAWSESPDAVARARIVEFIRAALDAVHVDVDLGYFGFGPFPGDNASSAETRLGIAFRVDAKDAGTRIVIKGRLTGPETTHPKGRVVEEFVHVASTNQRQDVIFRYGDGRERIAGTWELELRTLDGELLKRATCEVDES